MSLRDRLRRDRTPAEPRHDAGVRDFAASGWNNPTTGEILPGFDAPDGCVILDIGCGEQPHSAFFMDRDVRIILADIDPAVLSAGATAARGKGDVATLEKLLTDTDPLPLPDASVDRIVCTEVLEHVADPRQFLGELVRVARPGARILLAVPDHRCEELQKVFAAPEHFLPPNHIRVFDPGELIGLAESFGLEVTHQQFDGFFHTLWWLFFWISAQPDLRPPWAPLLESWSQTWDILLDTDRGLALKHELDQVLPKSEIIVAVKPEIPG